MRKSLCAVLYFLLFILLTKADPSNAGENTSTHLPASYLTENELVEKLRPNRSGRSRSIVPQPVVVDLDVKFDFASARLSPVSLDLLYNLAGAMKQLGEQGVRFSIEGHTCALGDQQVNQWLSIKRAETVAQFVQRQGVKSIYLSTVAGFGSRFLLNTTEPYSPVNRRVRITASAR